MNLQRGYPKKEILEKDSPILWISIGQRKGERSSRTNEEHVIHPAAILKGWFMESNGVWSAEERESQDPITWQTQNHEQLRDWDQNGQEQEGDEEDLFKDAISTKKSFDYFQERDYKRVHNLPPLILPTNLDYLG